MCGVVGVWRYGEGPGAVDVAEVEAIRDSMTARGPDGAGTWVAEGGRVVLAHRRLAIIGLGQQGHQPMVLSRCRTDATSPPGGHDGGEIAISYNGELYDYEALRRGLVARGHRFVGSSDTEVLLHLYEEDGIAMVRGLRGMFAFALWDGTTRELHLARDPLGIKPLYVADDGTTIRVASQARALLASPAVDRSSDEGALAALLVFGSIPEPRTAWGGIQSVGAGTAVTVQTGGRRSIVQYFSLARSLADAEHTAFRGPPGDDSTVAASLAASVQAHMVADVEVGVFLSGGIDSTSILGLASAGGRELHAITLGFDEFAGSADDEAPLAEMAARRYGAHHEVVHVGRSQFASWLPTMLSDMDQPTVDGLNTWMVAQAAAASGLKVALSGMGGDEFLGGYPSFLTVPRLVRRLRSVASVPGVGPAARAVTWPVLQSRMPKAAGLIEYADTLAHGWLLRRSVFMPYELAGVLGRERATSALAALDIDGVLRAALDGGPRGGLATVAALEGGCYLRNQLLRDADWAGMAHSLEIRVPLTDVDLLATVAPSLSARWVPPAGKRVLAASPTPELPTEISERSKTGFSVPMAAWATSLADYDSWRSVPALAHPRCSWARRWAHTVAGCFGML
jgi:asparagine synthase (glutamine-hydrolysing)